MADLFSVPQEAIVRDAMHAAVDNWIAQSLPVPPFSLEELQEQADALIAKQPDWQDNRNYLTVLVNNGLWRETIASIPCNRRVLLLPQCLRDSRGCPAEPDELGLLCEQCGRCSIGPLQAEAEEMGYVVLIAEGTTIVTSLLAQGKVDAVIGVSCMTVLEKTFSHMAAEAIPGIALPLFVDGCSDTMADAGRVHAAIQLSSDSAAVERIDLEKLRTEVCSWFHTAYLASLFKTQGSVTEEISLSWLGGEGKRWRPLLAASVYKAICGATCEISETMKRIAIAVECFHKASLIHDDIEDSDQYRYGEKTLHHQHGIAVALNIGDYLLGEGYRMVAESDLSAEQRADMLKVCANGHRTLCLGQGQELALAGDDSQASAEQILEMFRRKTSPAFLVALSLGAICSGADEKTCRVLSAFSDALGVAYQIRDDLEDTQSDAENRANEMSLLQAVSEDEARGMLDHYKRKSIRMLKPLQQSCLKSLLHRLVNKILK